MSSSTSIVGSATTPAGATDSPYRWAEQDDPALSLGGGATATISGVLAPTQGSQTWALAGSQQMADGATVATVWSSTDTSTWGSTHLASLSTTSYAASAAEWRNSTVVVGAVGSGSQERAAVWISQSGGPFVAVPVSPVSGPSSMRAVTAGALGLFAIGSLAGKPALWSSTNGLRWTLSSEFGSLAGSSLDPVVDAVLATNTSVYAAGSAINGTQTDAALWASGDGINWRRVSQAQAAFGGPGGRVITGLASIGTGLVAVGGVRTGPDWSPASWISPDGVSWSQPSEDFPMDSRPQGGVGGTIVRGLSSLQTLPGATAQLMAVGGGSSAQRIWKSNNGVSWSEVHLPAGAAASPDWAATVVGTTGTTTVVADSRPGQPYVLTYGPRGWGEPSADARVFGPVQTTAKPVDVATAGGDLTLAVDVSTLPQALGGPANRRTVFLSFDGSTWRADPTPDPSLAPESLPAGVSSAIRFGNEWVAVGAAAPAVATSTTSANLSGLAESWTSVDGVHWVSHGPLDQATGVIPERPTGLCVRPGPVAAVIAVGSSYQASAGEVAVAWISSDGVHWSRAAVSTPSLAGGNQEMSGCMATATGLVAFGDTTTPSGTTVPAIWRSSTGSEWTRQSSPGFAPAASTTLTSVAGPSSTWLAVASGRATPSEPMASQLWLSQDGGVSWLMLDTTGSPWQTPGPARLDLAAFHGGVPFVAGTVAGRLVVWSGTPALKPESSATSA